MEAAAAANASASRRKGPGQLGWVVSGLGCLGLRMLTDMEWSFPSRLARFVDRAGGQNHLQGIGPFANQEGAEPVL